MPVRLAQESDLPALVEMLRQLSKIEVDFRFDANRQRTGLEQLIASPQAYVFVLELGGLVAGMATIQELISTTEGGRVGLIEDVVIHRNFRGKGHGKELMNHLKAVAEELGYKRLQLLADEDNANGQAFYASQDWAPTNMKQWRWHPEY